MLAHGKAVTELPTHPSEDTRVEEPVIVKEDEAEVDLADVVVVVAVTADVVDEVVVAVASARELARHQSRLLRRHRHRPATNLQHLAKLKRVGFDEFFVFLCLFFPLHLLLFLRVSKFQSAISCFILLMSFPHGFFDDQIF